MVKNHARNTLSQEVARIAQTRSIHLQMITPCVGLCKMDQRAICIGCGRSLQEIAEWTSMTDQERQEIMDRLNEHTGNFSRLS